MDPRRVVHLGRETGADARNPQVHACEGWRTVFISIALLAAAYLTAKPAAAYAGDIFKASATIEAALAIASVFAYVFIGYFITIQIGEYQQRKLHEEAKAKGNPATLN